MFRSLTWVWTFVLGAAVGNMAWGAWSSLGPVIADRDLGGAATWGSILAAMGVGALLGSVIAVRAKPRQATRARDARLLAVRLHDGVSRRGRTRRDPRLRRTARGRRDDARQLALGVDADASCP